MAAKTIVAGGLGSAMGFATAVAANRGSLSGYVGSSAAAYVLFGGSFAGAGKGTGE